MDKSMRTEVNRAAKLRIDIHKGVVLELDGVVTINVGNMIGVKANANGKIYRLFHYEHTKGSNVYEGTLYAGKKRMPMSARLF